MSGRNFPKFPLDVIAGIGLGLAIVGAAAAFTLSSLGENFRLWWQARDWPAARCQVVRPLMHEDGLLYRYEFDGRRYQGSRIDIDDSEKLRASLRATAAGAELDCWVDPRNPARVLLNKVTMAGGGFRELGRWERFSACRRCAVLAISGAGLPSSLIRRLPGRSGCAPFIRATHGDRR